MQSKYYKQHGAATSIPWLNLFIKSVLAQTMHSLT